MRLRTCPAFWRPGREMPRGSTPVQAFALFMALTNAAAFRFASYPLLFSHSGTSSALLDSVPRAYLANPVSHASSARLHTCLRVRTPALGLRSMGAFSRRRGMWFSTLNALAGGKQKVVFLGTPEVAAQSLRAIIEASRQPDSEFEVTAVVSNPPAKQGRKKQLQSSPVHLAGEEAGIPVFTPVGLLKKHEGSQEFLAQIRGLEPDLCITAAYGQFLPKSFLSIPRLGTLNIHPSLLPKFRGASPVPRALEAGVDVTGVSVLFTVFEMDAGPIVARTELLLDGNEKADELLPRLFDMGSELLLEKLPAVFAGEHKQTGEGCIIQNDEDATHAAKMSKEEGELWFTENCRYMHNRVRAFAGWPGTSAQFVINRGEPDEEKLKVKIITTRVAREEGGAVLGVHQLKMNAKGDALVVTCDDGSQLEVLELQLPSKKPMDARAFWNGVRGRKIERARVPWSPGKVPGQGA